MSLRTGNKLTSSLHSIGILIAMLWISSLVSGRSETVLLQLRSGDRVTGAVINETTNHVVISNSWIKELAVPLREILKREIVATTNVPASTNIAVLTNKASTNIVLVAKATPTNKPPQRWHGEVQLGTDLGFSDVNRQLYYGRFKVTYARDIAPSRAFKNVFDFNATYGKTDGITSANQLNSSSKTDYDISKRSFIYNLAGVGYDQIRKIDLQYEVGPGVGYRVLTQSNLVLNAEAGMSFQEQFLSRPVTVGTLTLTDNYTQSRVFYRLAEDFKWVINKSMNLDEKFEFFPSDDFSAFRFRFESNLRYTFMEKFILTFTVLDTYDTQPAQDIPPNDLQIRSSIGLKF